MKVVNPYRVDETLKTIKEAMTTAAGGLKVIIARATVVKGYGDVRRRLAGALGRFLDEVLPRAVAADREGGHGYERALETVREARRLMLADEKGIETVLAHA